MEQRGDSETHTVPRHERPDSKKKGRPVVTLSGRLTVTFFS